MQLCKISMIFFSISEKTKFPLRQRIKYIYIKTTLQKILKCVLLKQAVIFVLYISGFTTITKLSESLDSASLAQILWAPHKTALGGNASQYRSIQQQQSCQAWSFHLQIQTRPSIKYCQKVSTFWNYGDMCYNC